MIYDVTIDGKSYRLELERADRGWRCRLDGCEVELDAVLARRDVLSVLIGGRAYEVKRERTATDMHLWVGSARYSAELRDPRSLRSRKDTDHAATRVDQTGSAGVGGADHGQSRSNCGQAGATQVDANTIRVPAASVTNQLQITGGAGDDHFVIDATGGCLGQLVA